ncbi:integrase [Stenotrophomonas sp. JAI102]|nr:integrase [Stenotrophomonas sp. JAI102]
MFAPEALAGLSESARWASLLGLYTGARASEVGQLLIKDAFEEDGIPCIRISDEGEPQKLRTEVSLRTVPLHPELLKVGFLDWVDGKRKVDETRLFPAAKATAVNGQGNWITKAFSRHLAEVGKD